MKDNRTRNVVSVRENGQISDFQLIMMSFRPISFFEIEDSYDELCLEIDSQVENGPIKDKMLQFVSVFKSTIDAKSLEPMIEFLSDFNDSQITPTQLNSIYQSLELFIDYSQSKPSLLN